MQVTITQKQVDTARDYFLRLAAREFNFYSRFSFECAEWQAGRDRYVSFSNTAAQLMATIYNTPKIITHSKSTLYKTSCQFSPDILDFRGI